MQIIVHTICVMDDIAQDLAPAGVLRASINLGNPVLAQGSAEDPRGITVDIARELARRLDLSLELVCFDAARKSFQAMTDGRADVCFLAIEPEREREVAFTAAYVVIEGVFVVPVDSPIGSVAEVDVEGVRIGVKQGSAYDLYLTRTLKAASVIRGDEGVEVLLDQGLEVGAGIREPATAFTASHPQYRLLPGRFMEIKQALGTTQSRAPATVEFLRTFIDELTSSGWIAERLS